MFGKLLKYEWRAMMRAMLPLYGAVLVISLLNGFSVGYLLTQANGKTHPLLHFVSNYIQPILTLLYLAILMVLVAFTVIQIIQRFYKGLLGREGYLMFTLPVSVGALSFSKALVSVVMSILSVMVALLSILLYSGGLGQPMELAASFGQFVRAAIALFREGLQSGYQGAMISGGIFLVLLALSCLIGLFAELYQLYCSMSLGQLANRHKAAMSVVWYLALSTAWNIVSVILVVNAGVLAQLLEKLFGTVGNNTLLILFGLGILLLSLVKLLPLLFGTNWLLNHKLNLE